MLAIGRPVSAIVGTASIGVDVSSATGRPGTAAAAAGMDRPAVGEMLGGRGGRGESLVQHLPVQEGGERECCARGEVGLPPVRARGRRRSRGCAARAGTHGGGDNPTWRGRITLGGGAVRPDVGGASGCCWSVPN
ncbi:hypothetical protein CALVIDRAFT_390645 [Calocera viscosa TUFC12733]|uniref:Uncharacterized protein n=1 Tax=Calocera viscosa (strain TUFC12733) TaxID=1330018 RepID=A0A167GG73_CALVF|nr:hypothetical protein CALVIDRAFT_390645 [Calocera viscosa TUFC12733]